MWQIISAIYCWFSLSLSECKKRKEKSDLNIMVPPEGDFSGGSVVKNPLANAGDAGSIPGSGRSPGEGNGNPLQHFCLENPMDRGAWWAAAHGVANSRTRLSYLPFTFTVGERKSELGGQNRKRSPKWRRLEDRQRREKSLERAQRENLQTCCGNLKWNKHTPFLTDDGC